MSFCFDITHISMLGVADCYGNVINYPRRDLDAEQLKLEYYRAFEQFGTLEIRDDEGHVQKLPTFKDCPRINSPDEDWVVQEPEFVFSRAFNGDGSEVSRDTTNGGRKLPFIMETFMRCLGMTVDSDEYNVFKRNFFEANSLSQNKYRCTFANDEEAQQFNEHNSKKIYSCYYHYAKTVLHNQENIHELYTEFMKKYKIVSSWCPSTEDSDLHRFYLLHEFMYKVNDLLGWQQGGRQTHALLFGLEEAIKFYEQSGSGFFVQLERIYGVVVEEEEEDSNSENVEGS